MKGTEDNRDTVKVLLRIDDTSELTNQIVEVYMSAAEEWLKNTGVNVDYSNCLILDAVAMYVGKRMDDPEGIDGGINSDRALIALAEQIRISQLVG